MKSLYPACAALLAILFPTIFSAQTPDTFLVTGCAKFWANGHPVNNLSIDVVLDYPGSSDLTFAGTADINSPCSQATVVPDAQQTIPDFWIYGNKPDTINDYRNGISISDLVCINQHILGLNPLSQYALLAADVNKSGSVTGFDLVELRKLLLGIYDKLPDSPSWRIWPANCTLPNPLNPFQPYCQAFPADSLVRFENQPANLTAIKIGDVNGDYDFDGNYQPVNMSDSIHLYLPDLALVAGVLIDVPIYQKMPFWVHGIQFALQYDTSVLQLMDIIPGAGTTQNDWAFFASEGLLKNASVNFGFSDTLGVVRFLVKSDGQMSDVIELDTLALQPLFTAGCGLTGKVVLKFEATSAVTDPPAVSWINPAFPNPFSEKTTISLALERPATLHLEVTDTAGRLTYSQSYELPQGRHQLEIPASAVPAGGLAFYRITTKNKMLSGKITKM